MITSDDVALSFEDLASLALAVGHMTLTVGDIVPLQLAVAESMAVVAAE
eukprot:CAMPEP_0197041130 /NCGR_PEP_ID=MMETSP1384-20130603/17726_1 /TAXON_ID=29189 /ORGANISM="Ammonia sp." /LENGTH=48 /DNA_ID= /DNA_START= /DNA_END= /DNA_ORIENTATION=